MLHNPKLAAARADANSRDILLGSVVGVGVKVLSAASIFIMNIVVTRTLGATEAGLFFLAFTLVTVAAAVGRLGLDHVLVRFIAMHHANNSPGLLHSVYRKSIAWVAGASILIALFGWLGIDWLVAQFFDLPGFSAVLHSMLLAIPLVALFTIQAQALQGLRRVAQSMLTLNVLAPLLLLLLLLAMPIDSADTLGLYYIIACSLTLVVGLVFWFQSAPARRSGESFSSGKLVRTTMPLWAVAVLSQVVQWSSQLMLGTWSSAQDVAFFATAQRTAMLTSFVLIAVNAIAAPKFAAMHARGDRAGLQRMAKMSVRLMLVAAVPALALMLLFPQWIMGFFGEEFRQASTALVILALGQFVNIASGSVGYLLSMTGHERMVRNNTMFSAILVILLGFFLIPPHGLLGASIATAVAIASQNLLGVYQVRRLLGFNTLQFWK